MCYLNERRTLAFQGCVANMPGMTSTVSNSPGFTWPLFQKSMSLMAIVAVFWASNWITNPGDSRNGLDGLDNAHSDRRANRSIYSFHFSYRFIWIWCAKDRNQARSSRPAFIMSQAFEKFCIGGATWISQKISKKPIEIGPLISPCCPNFLTAPAVCKIGIFLLSLHRHSYPVNHDEKCSLLCMASKSFHAKQPTFYITDLVLYGRVKNDCAIFGPHVNPSAKYESWKFDKWWVMLSDTSKYFI